MTTTVDNVKEGREWQQGTFACCNDCKLCCLTCFCPCYVAGRNAEYFGEDFMQYCCLAAIGIYQFLPVLRWRLRQQKGIRSVIDIVKNYVITSWNTVFWLDDVIYCMTSQYKTWRRALTSQRRIRDVTRYIGNDWQGHDVQRYRLYPVLSLLHVDTRGPRAGLVRWRQRNQSARHQQGIDCRRDVIRSVPMKELTSNPSLNRKSALSASSPCK